MITPLAAFAQAAALVSATTAVVDYGPGFGGNLPDNDAIGYLTPIVVEPSFSIESVAVRITGLQHGYCSDLTIELRHPGVSSPTTLCTNVGFGNSADLDGTYTFTDGGADLWLTADGLGGLDVLPPGAYQASGDGGGTSSLDAKYFGEDAQGPWVLRIYDDDFLVDGGFVEWELILDGGPACPEGIFGDLDGSGLVDFQDLLELFSAWGDTCGE